MPARHLLYLDRRLRDLHAGRIKRLIVTMPPRHGKSELCSRYFPLWWLARRPRSEVAIVSYEATFAESWSRKIRDDADEFGHLLGYRPMADSRSVSAWNTTTGGLLHCAGIGGPLTGKGADLLVIDDPVKNHEEANSPTIRQKHWDWWLSTSRTRLSPTGAVLLIMTRWHADDLAGRLLEQDAKGEGEGWTVVNLPAIAEEGDQLGREPGEALWPERWTLALLQQTRRVTDSPIWASLYQQRPGQGGGSEWPDEYFDGLLTRDWPNDPSFWAVSALTLDPSKGKSDKSDYCARAFVGLGRDGLFRVRVEMAREPTTTLVENFIAMGHRLRPHIVGVEANQFQELLVGEIARTAEAWGLTDLFVGTVPILNVLPKVLRIRQLGPFMALGRMLIYDDEGGRLLVRQLREFPHGKHDDGPDAVEMGLRLIAEAIGGNQTDGLGERLLLGVD